ncbi:hypothetical protein CHU33_06705 [Superficieibacter electus]|uniref:Uncharacterized protein n=1 Tax=Superficieibacter electus TaxID=2022662 RepID=A0ABX4ZH15_9ENTR|nr:hypothetical protein CHU33_06705 [Superficieibacter electus]
MVNASFWGKRNVSGPGDSNAGRRCACPAYSGGWNVFGSAGLMPGGAALARPTAEIGMSSAPRV